MESNFYPGSILAIYYYTNIIKFYFWNDVGINLVRSTLNLKGYENARTIEYTDLEALLSSIDPCLRGMIYIQSIESMKKAVALLRKRGISAVGIWAASNRNKPMDEEQQRVADSLIRNEMIPDDVQVLLFNAAYETGLNIRPEKSHLDYAIVHDTNDDVVVQARGRYRGDIETLYRKATPSDHTLAIDRLDPLIIAPYLGRKLCSEEKSELVNKLGIKNKNNRKVGWPTVSKALESSGYIVTKGKSGKRWWKIVKAAED